MKKSAYLLFLFSFCIFGCSKSYKSSKYVASTSWVAGIAELAGIDDVEIITPETLNHPPEYEITPDDMLKIVDADIVMYAGYERMIKVISNAAQIDKSKLIKVKTTNTLENIHQMVDNLSDIAGTQKEAEKRFIEYQKLIEETRIMIKESGLDKKTVHANINQAEFAKDLGLNVKGTFGTGPLTSDQIADIAENQYDIIIDNIHNPVAALALEVSPNSKYIVWRNFPNKKEKDAFYKVIKSNCEILFE